MSKLMAQTVVEFGHDLNILKLEDRLIGIEPIFASGPVAGPGSADICKDVANQAPQIPAALLPTWDNPAV